MIIASLLPVRLRIAGICLMIGLLIEALCLLSPRPIAFVLFVAIGGLLIFAGVVIFLISVLAPHGIPD
jgi:hypothetical protein